jgi:cation:H+ antiporter
MLYWLGFIICTGAIVYSGSRLSKFGDVIAEKLGLSRVWIGVVLLASATSLPELITGISSVTFAGVPDIAVGDVMGSCVFNLLLLAVLDSMHRDGPIMARAHQGNVLSAGFGILFISLAGLNILAGRAAPSIGWVGLNSLLIFAIYPAAIKLIYVHEKKNIARFISAVATEMRYEGITTRDAFKGYGVNAAVVTAAAVFLPGIGKGLAEGMGLGQTFVGNVFIAFSTSLPEMVVTIAVLRIGAIDLAIGNIFGSNIFNILILALDDLFFLEGPILAAVSMGHMVPAFTAVAMTAMAVVGLTYRQERKTLFLAWDSVGIVLMYIVNLMLLYALR